MNLQNHVGTYLDYSVIEIPYSYSKYLYTINYVGLTNKNGCISIGGLGGSKEHRSLNDRV